MRKLVLGMFMSLDGFVSGPNGEIDWVFKTGDDATDAWIIENLWQAGALAMGSRSFREMAGYWPSADTAFAPPMNEIPKIVFTKDRLGEVQINAAVAHGSWTNPFIARGDLTQEVARLKAQAGNDIRVLGGAGLAGALTAHNLIDEYQLMVCPVALGKGVPLFSSVPQPLDLKLVSTKAFSGGAVATVYRPV